ncbi:MAG: hypothetical protein LUD78_07510, partial [Clostridiales bacterium]|nr:hypothetical protein [Clostridiales bacterium]
KNARRKMKNCKIIDRCTKTARLPEANSVVMEKSASTLCHTTPGCWMLGKKRGNQWMRYLFSVNFPLVPGESGWYTEWYKLSITKSPPAKETVI